MDGIAIVDGKVTRLDEARISIMDRGYLLGDGVFETLRSHGGVVFRREEHLQRLEEGLHVLGLGAGLVGPFQEALDTLVKEGHRRFGDRLYLRVNVTTGAMADIAGGDGSSITGIARPFKPYPMKYYADGVHCIVAGRKDEGDPLACIKSLSFLPYVVARRAAHAATAHDAILPNTQGDLTEATTANLFALRDGVVHAPGPDSGALAGVTRSALLEIIQDTGFDVVETLDPGQLATADEAWLSNTTGGVVPLTRFREAPIADGKKGDLCVRLRHAYDEMVAGRA